MFCFGDNVVKKIVARLGLHISFVKISKELYFLLKDRGSLEQSKVKKKIYIYFLVKLCSLTNKVVFKTKKQKMCTKTDLVIYLLIRRCEL